MVWLIRIACTLGILWTIASFVFQVKSENDRQNAYQHLRESRPVRKFGEPPFPANLKNVPEFIEYSQQKQRETQDLVGYLVQVTRRMRGLDFLQSTTSILLLAMAILGLYHSFKCGKNVKHNKEGLDGRLSPPNQP